MIALSHDFCEISLLPLPPFVFRLPETGQHEEVEDSYTFYRSGRPSDEKSQPGVCFAIRTDMVNSLDYCNK